MGFSPHSSWILLQHLSFPYFPIRACHCELSPYSFCEWSSKTMEDLRRMKALFQIWVLGDEQWLDYQNDIKDTFHFHLMVGTNWIKDSWITQTASRPSKVCFSNIEKTITIWLITHHWCLGNAISVKFLLSLEDFCHYTCAKIRVILTNMARVHEAWGRWRENIQSLLSWRRQHLGKLVKDGQEDCWATKKMSLLCTKELVRK